MASETPTPSDIKTSTTSSNDEVGNKYAIPEPEAHTSFDILKERIRHHYELASDYYYSLWGEHIHHGYFLEPTDTKERAQTRLIELLLKKSDLPTRSTVLDVGCGIGGTSRYLAQEHACDVTGITISGRQVELARKLTLDVGGVPETIATSTGAGSGERFKLGDGSVQFIELDGEKMGAYFATEQKIGAFDAVWISEALSHFPNKELFFRNVELLLKPGGKLVIADWFMDEDLSEEAFKADIAPIEDGMLLPPLCTQKEYTQLATAAKLKPFSDSFDISKQVSKTWDISWSLIQNPAIWAFAISQGRDGLAFLQSFRAMRRGFANGNFRYAVMVFVKEDA